MVADKAAGAWTHGRRRRPDLSEIKKMPSQVGYEHDPEKWRPVFR
jgi:hypothetical protein